MSNEKNMSKWCFGRKDTSPDKWGQLFNVGATLERALDS